MIFGMDRALRQRLDALGPAPRAELLHVLMLPDLERSAAASTVTGIYETGATRYSKGPASTS